MKSRKSSCTTHGVGVGVCVGIGVGGGVGGGISVGIKFNIKVFYVMGKALSGELSCPCDRSCFYFYLSFIINGNQFLQERICSKVSVLKVKRKNLLL